MRVDTLKPFMMLKELKDSEEFAQITYELKEKTAESVKNDHQLLKYPVLRRVQDSNL
jgi:hypothetical protein